MIAARDDPSVESFLPTRGDGVVLSASDIDTYRTCPLKYKFARVFRIPQEPTIHQRFGIVVHQVLERFHGRRLAVRLARRSCSGCSTRLAARRVRRVRGGAPAARQGGDALERYHERFQSSEAEPMWFERPFTFQLGPHLLRGRVDRVDRLPGGEYELIDYKTGRPKSPVQLADDVQLSLYAVGAREAWGLEASQQAYYYVLDDQKVAVPDDREDRAEWIQEVAMEVADGILSQGFEPTPSFARARCATTGWCARRPSADDPGDGGLPPAPSGEQFEIAHGDQRATIVEVGGGVREYRVGDRDVLDPYPRDAVCDGAHGAPLIPWPNRLGDGRYASATAGRTSWR